MTVTIIVGGEVWFKSDHVRDLWLVSGILTVTETNKNWKDIEMKKVEQLLVTYHPEE